MKIFTPLHLREAVPDNVIQDEAEQEDRVPVRPPGPAGLAAGAGWPEAGGGREAPGEHVVQERPVVVRVLHLSHCQQSGTDSHQEDGQPPQSKHDQYSGVEEVYHCMAAFKNSKEEYRHVLLKTTTDYTCGRDSK